MNLRLNNKFSLFFIVILLSWQASSFDISVGLTAWKGRNSDLVWNNFPACMKKKFLTLYGSAIYSSTLDFFFTTKVFLTPETSCYLLQNEQKKVTVTG